MTLVAALGLTLMGVSLLVTYTSIRRSHLSYVGVIFLSIAFVFHAVGEVLQAFRPGLGAYRGHVTQSNVDSWLVVAGVAMLAHGVIYTGSLPLSPGPPASEDRVRPRWMTLLLVVGRTWLLAVGAAQVTGREATYWADGLVSQFLLLLIPLTAFLYIRSSPSPKFARALYEQGFQGVVLTMRGPILIWLAWRVLVWLRISSWQRQPESPGPLLGSTGVA